MNLTLVAILTGLTVLSQHFTNEKGNPELQPIPNFLRRELVKLFESGEILVPDGSDFKQMHYRLSKPVISPGIRYPLILYLNGHARRQMDYHNIGQLSHLDSLIFHSPITRDKYPFFLLVPQCPSRVNGEWLQWIGTTQDSADKQAIADPLEGVARIVQKVISQYPIDSDRVSVFGISSGGTASWELAMRNPNVFAAVVPLASFPNVEKDSRLILLKNIPVWAFHSSGDNPAVVRGAIEQLKRSDGDGELTEIPSDLHACWDEAFSEYDLLNWMLSQRRNGKANSARRVVETIWWQTFKHDYLRQDSWVARGKILGPPSIAIAALVAVFIAYRTQRRRKAQHASTTTSN